MCGMGGVGAVRDPHVCPQCPAEHQQGEHGWEKGNFTHITPRWEWLEELHFQVCWCRLETST